MIKKTIRMASGLALAAVLALAPAKAGAEDIAILHLGDQESWLISAQGNLRDTNSQLISFYGGIDRLATVMSNLQAAAEASNRFVIKLNAGDAFLPGPRFNASFANLTNAYTDGGQDFYDTIALRALDFDAITFGNHEFDQGADTAARFVKVSETDYLSMNLNLAGTPGFAALTNVAASKVITTTGGKKIGIIGATTPLLPAISQPGGITMTAGWSATNTEAQNFAALVPFLQAEVDDLRTNEGASVVILMSHFQNAQNEISQIIPATTNIDLVVSGGGHELMVNPADPLITNSVAATFTNYPLYVTNAAGVAVPLVTGHFGNRYVGEIHASLDDVTGALTNISSSRMVRVSGYTNDPDRVVGNGALFTNVVQPVLNYIAVLNATIIGKTGTKLNGPTHASGSFGNYTEGVRNAETGLGNLVADALRFAGEAEVGLQNGGGIRASISAPGNVTEGDTFQILPFVNIVKRAPAMNAYQLKDILEHGLSGASPSGAAQGRFCQVSGIAVTFCSTNTARSTVPASTNTGSRVQRVVMDDGTVLIDGGVVVNTNRTFSFATIDFLANGGDSYPFAQNGVQFENAVFSILYQEALSEFIQTPKADGGLKRSGPSDGEEITPNMYGEENAFDAFGRIVDTAVAVAYPSVTNNGTAGRNAIVGAANQNNRITGGGGADTLTGGDGGDVFVYTSTADAVDTIKDFTPYADKIDVAAFLASIGYTGTTNAFADGYLLLQDGTGGVSVQYDLDGPGGPLISRGLVSLKGLTAAQIVPARDFIFE